jgi:hypothetical protein
MDSPSSKLISSLALTGHQLFDIVLSSLIVLCFYTIGIGIYRLYLSPLARFPGPKLAALTQWYETYYDVYLDGKFLLHLEQLHEIYGLNLMIKTKKIMLMPSTRAHCEG